MTVTVSSSNAATHKEFTLLAVVKDDLGVTGSSEDGLLTGMIQQASDIIISHTGRQFARERVTETLPANDEFTMVLTRTPIVTVHAITHDGSTISSTSYAVDDSSAGILFRETRWTKTTLFANFLSPYPTDHGRRDWSVDYTAGYIMPGSSDARTLPHDLERACIDIVKSMYLSKSDNPNVKTQKVGDASETKFGGSDSASAIPPAALKVLNYWRRMEV